MSKTELKKYAQAVSIPLSVSDTVKWPIRAGRAIKPVKVDFANSFARQIDMVKSRYGSTFWNMAFTNPSQLWRVSHHLINGWREGGLDKEYIGKRIEQILEGIKQLSNGNTYEDLGPHLTMDLQKAQINNGITSPLVLKLSGLLWAYAETLFFVAREICCEYQGPYTDSADSSIIVRQYSNLCPIDLWPQLSVLHNVDSIMIKTKHKDLHVSFDVYNNLYTQNGNIMDSFVEGEVLINNQEVSLSEIQALIQKLTNEMIIIHSEIESMTEEEIIWQYIRIFWYRKKGLSRLLDESWEPPVELRSRLNIVKGSSGGGKKSADRPSREDVEMQYDFS